MLLGDFPVSELPDETTARPRPTGLTGDALRMNPDNVPVTGYIERCPSCKGRGRFISYSGRDCGPCFKCKGKGNQTFRTAPEVRSAARERAATVKANAATAFQDTYAVELTYLAARADRWDFARAMLEAGHKYNGWTENQLAAIRRAMARDAARAEANALRSSERAASAPVADVAKVLTALETAKGNGLKFPKLRLSGYVFSLASATSANAGAVYVKSGETYLGKIANGRFHASRDCGDRASDVIKVAADPAASAVAYGKLTGACSCCGRELTDPESVARGIGPICADRFGF